MNKIKIETLTDMINAARKYPKQLKILINDIENMIMATIEFEKISKKNELQIPTFFMWIPDKKNNATINIKFVPKTKF